MLKSLILIRFRALASALFSLGHNKKRRSPLVKAGIAFLVIYVVAVLLSSMAMLFLSLAKSLCGTENEWLYFALTSLLTVLFCFIGSVFVTQSTLFEAKDNELLVSMPIPAGYILLSRFVAVFMLNFAYSVLMFLPAGFMHFKKEGFDPVCFVLFVVSFLLTVMLATTLSCVFGWISALISSRIKKKALIQTALMFVFMGAYFAVCFNAQKYLLALSENVQVIAAAVKKYLSVFYCMGVGVSQKDYLYFLVFVLVSLLSFAAVYFVLSKSFYRIVTTKRSAAKAKYVKKEMKTRGKRSALVRKELSYFFSNAAYLMNCGSGSVFAVIFAVIFAVKGEELFYMMGLMYSSASFLPALVGAVFCFCAATTNMTAPSISLEGKNFPLLKAMPLTAREIFQAKILANLTVGALPISISAFVSGVALGLGVTASVIITLLSLCFLVFTSVFGLCANVLFPKLEWINPTTVIKQSTSVLISVLGGLLFITLMTVVGVMSDGLLDTNVFLLCMSGFYLALAGAFYLWLIKKGSELFEKI